MIVTSNFAETPAVTAVVAFGLMSIVGSLGCALLLRKLSAASPPSPATGSVPS